MDEYWEQALGFAWGDSSFRGPLSPAWEAFNFFFDVFFDVWEAQNHVFWGYLVHLHFFMSTHSQMATDVCFSSRYFPPTPSYAMADACWAQLLTYDDHNFLQYIRVSWYDHTVEMFAQKSLMCWSHHYVFWTEVIGFDNTFLDFRWIFWLWPYCNDFWTPIGDFDHTCTTFVKKSMILTILSRFLL